MTDQRPSNDLRTKTRLGWVDYTGLAAAAALTAGVWIQAGVGWALITLGILAGSLWGLLEVILNPQIYPLLEAAITGREPREKRRP